MSASKKAILITGATGKQGGALISALLASSSLSPSPEFRFHLIALTRSASSPSAQRLISKALQHITLLEGDLSPTTNVSDIFARASAISHAKTGRPLWGVYSVQINSDTEEAQGWAVVDSAAAAGVFYFVYSSGDRGGPEKSPLTPTHVKNFAAKYNIEKHLEATAKVKKMGYTILRPVTFMENVTEDVHGKGFVRMWEQMGPQKTLQLVSARDIGWFAAQAFLHPDKYDGKALSLVGDELTQGEAEEIFHRVVGREMKMAPCLVASGVKWVMKGTVGELFRWFEEEGYGGNVEECKRWKPEMLGWEEWLRQASPWKDEIIDREARKGLK